MNEYIRQTVETVAERLGFDADHIEHERYRVYRRLYAASFEIEVSPVTDEYTLKVDGMAEYGKEVDFITDEMSELLDTILAELNNLTN